MQIEADVTFNARRHHDIKLLVFSQGAQHLLNGGMVEGQCHRFALFSRLAGIQQPNG